MPHLHFTVEDMIAEGDKVVARHNSSGTQQGVFLGIPPTGKHITTTGIDIMRIAGGKFVEHWEEVNNLRMLQQLGVIPSIGYMRETGGRFSVWNGQTMPVSAFEAYLYVR